METSLSSRHLCRVVQASCCDYPISAQHHTTLAISAQFHVIFDDWFTTVVSTSEEDDDDPIGLDESWLDEQELAHLRHQEQKKV